MEREVRRQRARLWDRAFGLELVGARRRALTAVIRSLSRPTLGDLLSVVGEQLCDIAETPDAGKVRLGDLLPGRAGEGPFVGDLLCSLGIDPTSATESAEQLGLDLAADLSSFIDPVGQASTKVRVGRRG